MPSFGPISGAPVGAESPSGSPATATPAGVSAFAAVGVPIAVGGTSSTAQPAGVSAFARVGAAGASGGLIITAMFCQSTIIRFAPINRSSSMSDAALNQTANLL